MKQEKQYRNPYPLGAHMEGQEVRFSFVSKKNACGILLYDRQTGRRLQKLPFLPEERTGNIYCKRVRGINPGQTAYQFYEEGQVKADKYAREFQKPLPYGKTRRQEELRAVFSSGEFDWGEDKCPRIPYSEMIGYCLHVRGFTKHSSSGVRHRGTFAGIEEKIGYLKEIGVTTLELQPAYEFLEAEQDGESGEERPLIREQGTGEPKLNYWGYKEGFYYAPKAAYAASDRPGEEMKHLVRQLHARGMELVLQFYFPKGTGVNEIAEILHFWVLEYHVDGFHLMGEEVGENILAADPLLADVKLWYYRFRPEAAYGEQEFPAYPHLAEYRDDWMYDMRRFLKGDENMLGSALYHMRHIPEKMGSIHYFNNYYGFTLADMVSYECKHNQANGEENRDGNDYNCTWNCGEEGATRKARIKRLRLVQMKNALCLLLLSQSTPLIFMGDEFGNSQKGNNNPYCQDNGVTWLDWKDADKNRELLAFWKQLCTFRKSHPVLHPQRELRLMDYLACGYPDLSYHGQRAWTPGMEGWVRHIGQMYCGRYAGEEDTFLYVAVNMHWEGHELALPRLPRGLRWETVLTTGDSGDGEGVEKDKEQFLRTIPPRSICVYSGRAVSDSGKGNGFGINGTGVETL